MMRQIARFGIVGAAAMGTHLAVLTLLTDRFSVPPLLGNVLAFLVAYQVSFFGHHHWTFKAARGRGGRLLAAYLRFFLVSVATSFLLNEALYALLLRNRAMAAHPVATQIPVQAVVAGATFLAGKFWAFRKPAPPTKGAA